MLALEISVNGKALYTVSSDSEFGSVAFHLLWSRIRTLQGPVVESAFLFSLLGGAESDAGSKQTVKSGDEVTIRLIESGTAHLSANGGL